VSGGSCLPVARIQSYKLLSLRIRPRAFPSTVLQLNLEDGSEVESVVISKIIGSTLSNDGISILHGAVSMLVYVAIISSRPRYSSASPVTDAFDSFIEDAQVEVPSLPMSSSFKTVVISRKDGRLVRSVSQHCCIKLLIRWLHLLKTAGRDPRLKTRSAIMLLV
jgi:hypothetical protein